MNTTDNLLTLQTEAANEVQSAETVGQIAAKDLSKAAVFKKFEIDFCCGGKKTLKQACEEKGLDIALVEAELQNVTQPMQSVNNFNEWQPDFLADYIYNQHHIYYYNEMPVIKELLVKVKGHHGDNHPELNHAYSLFGQLVQELDTHFMREEKVVFPFIKTLMLAKKTGNYGMLKDQASLAEPLQIMQADHDAAGDILDNLKKITTNYTAPEDACNSYRLLYKKLKDLDEDLHLHIHLENNILFPKALKLEKELRS